MKLNRRQFGLLSGAFALEVLTGCASGAKGTSDKPAASEPSAGLTTAPAPATTSKGALAAGVSQALRSNRPRGAAGSAALAGGALNTFGSSLLEQLPTGENAVLSPYSIYAVLAMARAGAKGATAAQLDAALGSASTQAGALTAIDKAVAAALLASVAAEKQTAENQPGAASSSPVAVDVANSIWVSPTLQVHQSYLDALAAGFGVGMYKINYRADPDAARLAINAWVSQHTEKLIPALLAKGVIDEMTVLTLVNALYLSAPWKVPFNVDDSALQFATAAGSAVSVPSISVDGDLASASGKNWKSVTLPYLGGGLAMTVVLPVSGAFAAVRAHLAKVLQVATSSSESGKVNVTMPKFKAQTHLSLKDAMEALGVTCVFDRNGADLSGIEGRPGDIYATDLVHQSVISVDEKGTQAAAATAMPMMPASMSADPVKTFIADRPFLYAIHDTVTGAPLFLGQITDPTK